MDFTLGAESKDYSLVVVGGLLTVAAFLIENRL